MKVNGLLASSSETLFIVNSAVSSLVMVTVAASFGLVAIFTSSLSVPVSVRMTVSSASTRLSAVTSTAIGVVVLNAEKVTVVPMLA